MIREGGTREVQAFPDSQWERLSSQWTLNENVNAVHAPHPAVRKARIDGRGQTWSASAYLDKGIGSASPAGTFLHPMGSYADYVSALDDAGVVARLSAEFGGTWSSTRISVNGGQVAEYYYSADDIDTVVFAGGFARFPNTAGQSLTGYTVSTGPDTSLRQLVSITPEPLGGTKFAAEAALSASAGGAWGVFSIDNNAYPGEWLVESDQPGQYFAITTMSGHGFYPIREVTNQNIQPQYNMPLLDELGDEIFRPNFFATDGNYTVTFRLASMSFYREGYVQVYFGLLQVGTFFVGGSPVPPDQLVTFTGPASAGSSLRVVVPYSVGVTVELLSVGTAAESRWLETYGNDTFSIVYQAADVREPFSRSATASRTITVPGTGSNEAALRHVLDASRAIDLNRKIPAAVYVESTPVVEGYLQVQRVVERPEGHRDYEVGVFADVLDIFEELGDTRLRDLDLSGLDHEKNFANVTASWTAPWTNGYVYPLVQYGSIRRFDWADVSTSGGTVELSEVFPATYVRWLVDRMAERARFTIVSDFFDTPAFTGLVLPAATTLRTYDVSVWVRPMRLDDPPVSQFMTVTVYRVPAGGGTPEELASVWFSGLYLTSLSTWAVMQLRAKLDQGDTLYAVASTTTTAFRLEAGTFIEVSYRDEEGDAARTLFRAALASDLDLATNDSQPIVFSDVTGSYTGGVGTFSMSDPRAMMDTGTGVATIDDYDPAAFLPDMTCRELMQGLVGMFNLHVETSVDAPRTVRIEPRSIRGEDTGFYDRSLVARDLTARVDRSQPITHQLLPEVAQKDWRWSYADDDDYYNKNHRDDTGRTYGERRYQVDSDWADGEAELVLPFAPTPLVAMTNTAGPTTVALSDISSRDDAGAWKDAGKVLPRILYYKYVEVPAGSWWFDGVEQLVGFPWAGHVDDPYAPALDLNFGQSRSYYYPHLGGTTLFERYYREMVDEMTDLDSRLTTCTVRLGPADASTLAISDRLWVNGWGWHRLNRLEYAAGAPLHKIEMVRATRFRLQDGMTVIK